MVELWRWVMVTSERIDVTVSDLADGCRGTARCIAPELPVLFGRIGLVLGALLTLHVGNPLSGLNSAPELPPTVWGQLGQFLPRGANATLLHSTPYIDGAGASTAITVLTCWAMVGSLIIAIAMHRRSFPNRARPGGSIPQGNYLDRLDTQPNLFAPRSATGLRTDADRCSRDWALVARNRREQRKDES
jgi:hypothetical protein